MIQSVVRYLLTAATAFLAGKGVLTEGQDLASLSIEQGVILLVTLAVTVGWSKLQKLWQKKAE
jgi:hypothetical protein